MPATTAKAALMSDSMFTNAGQRERRDRLCLTELARPTCIVYEGLC